MTINTNRYPIAPHLKEFWTKAERTGDLVVNFGEPEHRLVFVYQHYTPPVYFLGDHFLATATLDGNPLKVTEKYAYKTVTNSRTVEWKGSSTSEVGECVCSEIVMADDRDVAMEMIDEGNGVWTFEVRAIVDQTFDTYDAEVYICKGKLDISKKKLTLRRSYYRDAST